MLARELSTCRETPTRLDLGQPGGCDPCGGRYAPTLPTTRGSVERSYGSVPAGGGSASGGGTTSTGRFE